MTFQTYYPISPATDDSMYLEAHETFPTANGEEGSVIIVQTADSEGYQTSGAGLSGCAAAMPNIQRSAYEGLVCRQGLGRWPGTGV
jgi:hypothetical protein